jgi:hypothetical protein
VPLQKAVEPQEHASFRVVAESPRAHERSVIAHQIAKNAAKPWQLPQRIQHLVGLRGKDCPQDRLATLYAVFGAQLGDGIAGDRSFPHEEVEESIYDAGTVENRGS